MNILFSLAPEDKSQIIVSTSIVAVLQKIGKTTFMCKEFFQEIGNTLEYSLENNRDISFNIVIAYTSLGLKQVLPFARQRHIPIVYVVKCSEIATEYHNISSVSKMVLIGGEKAISTELLRKDLIKEMSILPPLQFLFHTKKTSHSKDREGQKHLLVDISSVDLKYSPIYQMTSLFNVLAKYKITILYEDNPLLPIFNTNITTLDKSKVCVDSLITQSDIILANGETILKAVMAGKPCVVVGELGYGGIITPKSLKIYYKNNFQGRIGGYLNEYIPQHILQDDIHKLMMLDFQKIDISATENKQALEELYKEHTQQWHNLLKEIIQQDEGIKIHLIDCVLQLSSDFSLLTSPNDKFALIYETTSQVHSNFGKEEASIISLFRKPIKVKKVLERSNYRENSKIFMEFIQILVNEKILVPYVN